jgi:ABC-type tungstate transport system permease subunit
MNIVTLSIMQYNMQSELPEYIDSTSPLMPTDMSMVLTVHLPVSSPFWRRYADSALLTGDPHPDVSNLIHARPTAIFGNPSDPVAFNIGNGGAGQSGILKLLCEAFIAGQGGGFRIAWISNHSRHTQIALLGDVVQVGLTYEPEYEDLALSEGWAERKSHVFNDHFILAGPESNPANVKPGSKIKEALSDIAVAGGRSRSQGEPRVLFHTRGDGSATFYKELELWSSARIDLSTTSSWRKRVPGTPYEALLQADKDGVYLFSDRATYLTAKRDGALHSTRVYVEEGQQLLNPCSALVNTKAPCNLLAHEFATWLGRDDVQGLVRDYGRAWLINTPVFSTAAQKDINGVDRLMARL